MLPSYRKEASFASRIGEEGKQSVSAIRRSEASCRSHRTRTCRFRSGCAGTASSPRNRPTWL